MKDKRIIGKSDKADFLDWALKAIPIKIDTGAYRSSIDCSYAKVKKQDKTKTLHYVLLNENHPAYTGKVFETHDFKTSRVKSSNGIIEKRYIVKSRIKLFGLEYEAEFSLTGRTDMRFPVLIGRKLLNNNFVVDTTKTNLSFKSRKKKKNSENCNLIKK